MTFAIDADAEAGLESLPRVRGAPKSPSTSRTAASWRRPAPPTCSWSIRSTARGPRWRGWRPPASRSPRPRWGDGDPDDGRRRGRERSSRSSPGSDSWPCGARGLESDAPVALSANRTWTGCSGPTACAGAWRARPRRGPGDLIDRSSVGGGTFDLGSAAYDLTRVLTGQLDAYVEPGPRMIAEVPRSSSGVPARGQRPRAQQLALRPAAAVLLLEEAGAVVTDAAGQSLRRPPAARLRRTSSR